MNPVIVNYSDYASNSPFNINPRYEPKKSFKTQRKIHEKKKQVLPIVLYEPKDEFSTRPLCVMDVNLPKPQTPQKKTRPCSAQIKKSNLPSEVVRSDVDWKFEPISKHREGWLFRNNKPESHFTPKIVNKKIPLSVKAVNLKNHLNIPNENNPEKINENQFKAETQSNYQVDLADLQEKIRNYDIYEEEPQDKADVLSEIKPDGSSKAATEEIDIIGQYFPKLDDGFWHQSEYKSQFNRINTASALMTLQGFFKKNNLH